MNQRSKFLIIGVVLLCLCMVNMFSFVYAYDDSYSIIKVDGKEYIQNKQGELSIFFDVNGRVPKGYIGAIYFTPFYVNHNCIYYNYDVYGKEPLSTQDGFYELVIVD